MRIRVEVHIQHSNYHIDNPFVDDVFDVNIPDKYVDTMQLGSVANEIVGRAIIEYNEKVRQQAAAQEAAAA